MPGQWKKSLSEQIDAMRTEFKQIGASDQSEKFAKVETMFTDLMKKFEEILQVGKNLDGPAATEGTTADMESSDSDSGERIRIKVPSFNVGDDVEGFLNQFDIVADCNRWKGKKRARVFPSFLPAHKPVVMVHGLRSVR